MFKEAKDYIRSHWLVLVVIVLSFMGMLSWILDIPLLRGQIAPDQQVSMKWFTAFCFFLVGISGLFVDTRKNHYSILGTVATAGWVCGFNILLLLGYFTHKAEFIVQIGYVASDNPYQSVAQVVPSIMTAASLVLLSGLIWVRSVEPIISNKLRWTLLVTTGISICASIGYLVNKPEMYYYWEDFSSAMAPETIGLILLTTAYIKRLK